MVLAVADFDRGVAVAIAALEVATISRIVALLHFRLRENSGGGLKEGQNKKVR